MHILHITPSYKPAVFYGGPIVSIGQLAEAQVRRGARVTVFTTTANGPQDLPVPIGRPQMLNGVEVWYFRRWTGDHGHLSPALLWKFWLSAPTVQCVHLHSWWNWVAFGTVLICRLRGVKPVFSPRGMLSPYSVKSRVRQWFQRTLGRWLLGTARLHATSNQEARELQQLHPHNSCTVIPNIIALPPAIIRLRQGDNTTSCRLLFLSRIDPKKGLDVLLEALRGISLPWHLSIAGDGPPAYVREVHEQLAQTGLAKQVDWRGWTTGDEKFRLLSDADLLVLPSRNENFANVVLESLALGTPVLLSDQVGLADFVKTQDLGWISSLDIPTLQETLGQAIGDQQARDAIRKRAPGFVRTVFAEEPLTRQYLEFYTT